jgi:hypothetical protein
MDYPTVEPWTQLPSPRFLNDVLATRRRELALVAAAERGDIASVRAWVEERWPSEIQHVFSGHLPQPGPSTERPEPEVIDYSRVVHNRPLVDDEHLERVANIVIFLMTWLNVDEFAEARVYLLDGPGWAEASKVSRVTPIPRWRWSVEDGNHRLIAQHILGIGPYAVVRVSEGWW